MAAFAMRMCIIAFAFALGCGGSSEVFGTHARYAPAYRAYVLGPEEGSDDPEPEDARVLVDPLTGAKLRCREQLEPWLAAQQDAAEQALHDERWEIGSVIGMFPATAVAAVGGYFMGMGASVALLPAKLASHDDAEELYEQALEDFERNRYHEAARKLELALVKDGDLGRFTPAFHYLGIAYAELGRHDRARAALRAFVERSLVRDADAYRKSERWLRYLGAPLEPCRSANAVPLRW